MKESLQELMNYLRPFGDERLQFLLYGMRKKAQGRFESQTSLDGRMAQNSSLLPLQMSIGQL